MTDPLARPVPPPPRGAEPVRAPQAFLPAAIAVTETEPDFELPAVDDGPPPGVGQTSGLARLAWGAGGLFVSLGVGLWADRVVEDLFARYKWLGWAGMALLAAFVVAVLAIIVREIWAARRLKTLGRLRADATEVLLTDRLRDGRRLEGQLVRLYAARPDLARARQTLAEHGAGILDGAELVRYAERTLMAPLDARARALTAASARRVALVTTVSPRALVDIAFVIFESVRLAGAIAALYGARPGLFGFWRLTGAVLSHLAVTGGLVLTDGVVEQLLGQGLAARLSQRLGEGVVNGLMTVRVGIAAMRVVRPLPFETEAPPQVRDFVAELTKVGKSPP